MKKISIFLIIFCISVFYAYSAADIETGFGVRLGMNKSECIKQLNSFVDNLKLYIKSTEDSSHPINKYLKLKPSEDGGAYSFGYTSISYEKSDNASLFFPVRSRDTVRFINFAAFNFDKDTLSEIVVNVMTMIDPESAPVPLREIAAGFLHNGFTDTLSTSGKDRDGKFSSILIRRKDESTLQIKSYAPSSAMTYDVKHPKRIYRSRKYLFILRNAAVQN